MSDDRDDADDAKLARGLVLRTDRVADCLVLEVLPRGRGIDDDRIPCGTIRVLSLAPGSSSVAVVAGDTPYWGGSAVLDLVFKNGFDSNSTLADLELSAPTVAAPQ